MLRELPVQPVQPTGPVAGGLVERTDDELRKRWHRRLRGEIVGFVMPNLVCNGIWALGPMSYWWPGWVLGATGIGIVNTLARGFDPDAEREKVAAEQRARAMAEIEMKRVLGGRPER